MTSWIELPVAEIVEQYEAGASASELGRRFGVATQTVLNRLRSQGVQLRPWSPLKQHPLPQPPCSVEWVVAMYEAGGSIRGIAAELGTTYSVARRWLLDAGVRMRGRGGLRKGTRPPAAQHRMDLPVADIAEGYLSGLSAAELGRRYHASDRTILDRLRERGVPIRLTNTAPGRTTSPGAEVLGAAARMYRDGGTIHGVAARWNVSYGTARRWLLRAGVQLRERGWSLNMQRRL